MGISRWYSIKINELVEKLADFVEDRAIIFVGIEELRAMGYNIINFTLDLGQDIEYAAISFEYILAMDEVKPIAFVVHLVTDRVKNMNMEYVMKVLLRYNGYLYGSQEAIGFLIPIRDDDVENFIRTTIPKFVEEILGYSIKPHINGYTIDIQI